MKEVILVKTTQSKPTTKQNKTVSSKNGTKHQRGTVIVSILASFVIVAAFCALMVFIAVISMKAGDSRNASQLQKLSNSNFGDSFGEFAANIQDENPQYEIIAVFDKNGQKLIEYTNQDKDGVFLPDEAVQLLRNFRHLTHVHNHPYTDSGHSDNDLSMPCRVGLDKAIDTLVIVGQEHLFYMNRGKQSWPNLSETMNYFMKLLNSPEAEQNTYIESIFKDGFEYFYFTDACLEEFAKDFGYEFYTTTLVR